MEETGAFLHRFLYQQILLHTDHHPERHRDKDIVKICSSENYIIQNLKHHPSIHLTLTNITPSPDLSYGINRCGGETRNLSRICHFDRDRIGGRFGKTGFTRDHVI
eukprot:sb/3477832/